MDETINLSQSTQETRTRNRKAWEKFANPEDDSCRYCPHDRYDHSGLSEQPFVWVESAESGRQGAFSGKFQKRFLSEEYEIRRLFCLACAEDLETTQVLCYLRSVGVGEKIRSAD